MVLPLAITFAMKSATKKWLYRGILVAIGFAIFLSISRSAMLCALVAIVVLAATWGARARLIAVAMLLTLSVVV